MKSAFALKKQPYEQLYYGQDKAVSCLLDDIKDLPDETIVGWEHPTYTLNQGWVVTKGFYYGKEESFYDAFDRTTYYTNVWYLSKEKRESSDVNGVDFSPYRNLPINGSDSVIIENLGQLKVFLENTNQNGNLYAASENFELGGSMVPFVRLIKRLDEDEKVWLILSTPN